jgi:hypothetical protein
MPKNVRVIKIVDGISYSSAGTVPVGQDARKKFNADGVCWSPVTSKQTRNIRSEQRKEQKIKYNKNPFNTLSLYGKALRKLHISRPLVLESEEADRLIQKRKNN